jgi:hypothetical protein
MVYLAVKLQYIQLAPCVFVDVDEENEMQGNAIESTSGANECDNKQIYNSNYENYWLNEIKSQEDTARQIMSISVLLLVGFIAAIANNNDKLINLYHYTLNESLLFKGDTSYWPYETILMILQSGIPALIIFLFFGIWLEALSRARKALRLQFLVLSSEDLEKNWPSEHLEEIARVKQHHCERAIGIIIWGMLSTVSLVFALLILYVSTNLPIWPSHIAFIILFLISFYALSKLVDDAYGPPYII